MKLTAAANTDQGRVRHQNQDSYGVSAGLGLYLVADGMGGHAGGKRASEETARVVADALAASATDASARPAAHPAARASQRPEA